MGKKSGSLNGGAGAAVTDGTDDMIKEVKTQVRQGRCRIVGQRTETACLKGSKGWSWHRRTVIVLWCPTCDSKSGSCAPDVGGLAGYVAGPAAMGGPGSPGCEVQQYGAWIDTGSKCQERSKGEWDPAGPGPISTTKRSPKSKGKRRSRR